MTGSRSCSSSCASRPTRPRSTRPRNCSAWSPSSTAPGWPASSSSSGPRLPSCCRGWSTTSCWQPHGRPRSPPGRPGVARGAALDVGAARSSTATGATSCSWRIDAAAGAVHLRLLGSCDGCPSSAVTLRTAVETAIVRGRAGDHRHRRGGAASADAGLRLPSSSDASRPWACGDRRRAAGGSRRRPPAGPRPDPPVAARERPRPGERCEMCAEPDPGRARSRRRPRAAQPRCAPAAAATCSSPRPAPAVSRYRAVPDRYLSFPDFAALPRPVGRAADPGERGLLLPQLDPGPGGGLLPEPGRGHGVAAAPRHLGRDGRRQSRLATLLPDVEAFLVRVRSPGRGAAECYLVPIDACYELVGTAAPAVAGLRRRRRRPTTRSSVLRRGARAVPRRSRSPS